MNMGIKTQKLTKKYKNKYAVNELDLEIGEGEFFALLGVNGAGKSTAIRMLSCLTKPSSGDALLMGKSIVREPIEVKTLIGVSPQETAVAPNLSVRENLELIYGIYGHSRVESKEKAEKTIREFGMEEYAASRAKVLSGGWQRRLSIAMALIAEPQILFLDEPTLGLDVIARRELWNILKKQKGKITIILTTHYLEEAEALSDRIGIIAGGVLKAVGTADELKTSTGCEKFEDAFIKLAGEEGMEI